MAPPPWEQYPSAYGRIRVTEDMAQALLDTLSEALERLWVEREASPPGSEEAYRTLMRIRQLEKVKKNLEGTAEEKRWELSPPL